MTQLSDHAPSSTIAPPPYDVRPTPVLISPSVPKPVVRRKPWQITLLGALVLLSAGMLIVAVVGRSVLASAAGNEITAAWSVAQLVYAGILLIVGCGLLAGSRTAYRVMGRYTTLLALVALCAGAAAVIDILGDCLGDHSLDRSDSWFVLFGAISTGLWTGVYAALLWNVRTKNFFAAAD